MDLYTPQEQQDLDTFLTLHVSGIPQQTAVAHAMATLALSKVQSRLPH